ncbi:uncharacterized protein LOC122697277 isoform X1 [Cervus elaphus]|uniref:uncharacterized protein LOC122697277 isoform X1 n=1 Tax=Cervus elaphus TaxID=9860 RepID=UPI001CC274F7|nr:uncharacterized protein LOC122697277 isoform X1 [Cervus elaphus]XP_043763805.1 uncharacterized protein LOC122697277 isoform X1 [Cervus elaphus]
MDTSSIFLCILFLGGALGLTTSSAQRQLHCYTCNFAKPCYPVPTKCQDDEVCGISIGTSERGHRAEGLPPKGRVLPAGPHHLLVPLLHSPTPLLRAGPVQLGYHATSAPQPPPHHPARPGGQLHLGRPLASSSRLFHCHCGPGNTCTEIFGDLPKSLTVYRALRTVGPTPSQAAPQT